MTWTRTYTTTTTASPGAIWTRWTTPSLWVDDDPDTVAAEFATPPTVGTVGTVTDRSSTQRIRFTRILPDVSMEFEIALPGATLAFPHTMAPTDLGLKVTHGITISGPLAQVYALLVGRRLIRGLPTVVNLVVDRALTDDRAATSHQ